MGRCELDPTVMQMLRTVDVDALTREVLDALSAAGVEPILLKGPAIAQWLYRDGERRTYVDVDLLISPSQMAAAERAVRRLRFRRVRRDYESDLRLEHDSLWRRPDRLASVDLHRTLPQVRGASPEQVWRHLEPRTVEMDLPAPATRARVLDEPARVLLVALHAAHHVGYGEVGVQPLVDLERAVAQVSMATWSAAAEIARALRAEPQLSRGLHWTEGGVRIAAALALSSPSSALNDAAGFERLAAARSLREGMTLIGRSVLPPPSYLRWSSRLARSGRLGLALAYLAHPFVVAANAPRGYLAWRHTRRQAC